MPNKENIRKWVEALRSGDFPQTTSTLADSDGYCCLGVACDISGLGRWGDDLDGDYSHSTYVVEVDGVVRLAGEVLADQDHLNITEGMSFDSVRDLVRDVVERDQRHAHTYETR